MKQIARPGPSYFKLQYAAIQELNSELDAVKAAADRNSPAAFWPAIVAAVQFAVLPALARRGRMLRR